MKGECDGLCLSIREQARERVMGNSGRARETETLALSIFSQACYLPVSFLFSVSVCFCLVPFLSSFASLSPFFPFSVPLALVVNSQRAFFCRPLSLCSIAYISHTFKHTYRRNTDIYSARPLCIHGITCGAETEPTAESLLNDHAAR